MNRPDMEVVRSRLDGEIQRVLQQVSGDEVPGFAARTTIDDVIGKLYAVRKRLRVPVPDGLQGILDDIEHLTEDAVDLALNPDADGVEDELERVYVHGMHVPLTVSGSRSVRHCSCGSPTIEERGGLP